MTKKYVNKNKGKHSTNNSKLRLIKNKQKNAFDALHHVFHYLIKN